MKPITEREKAAIYYHLYAGCDEWTTLYLIAYDGPAAEWKSDRYLSDRASKWKRSEKIRSFLEEARKIKNINEAEHDKEITRKAMERTAESESAKKGGKGEKGKFIDYADPANQRAKLNELVNQASDPGEALDALKVIIAGQRDDKQAAREQQTQRFYTPKQCEGCEIKAAFAKLTGKKVIL